MLSAFGAALILGCGGASNEAASPTPRPNIQPEFGPIFQAGSPAWRSRAPLPTPRSEVASAVLEGKIYIAGGFVATGQSTSIVEMYDPAADVWSRKAGMPEARDHAMAVALDGRLYVFGGGLGSPVRTAFVYSPSSDSWARLPDMPYRRTSGGAGVIAGKVLLAGGVGESPSATMVYDPSANSWSSGPSLPAPREHLAVVSAAGGVFVIGGRWDGALKATNEVLDSLSGSFRQMAAMPTPRGGTSGGVARGRILVAGGEAFDPSRTFPQVEVFDPAGNTWSPAPDLPTPRHGLAVQGVGDTLYVIGGGPRAGLSVAPQNEALQVS